MNYSLSESSDYCSRTLQPYVSNITSSYADQRNEATMVATSVVMFLLAALFFNLNLFSAFSDISAILNPSVRLFLSSALSLFLPVMSYLFSEAKNNQQQVNSNGGEMAELSLRARTILMWMLLVELLRKKVEAILSTEGVQGYSGTIERGSRIAWLGYLVFYNIRGAGKKAFYSTLWVLAAAKLVQRFVTSELAKRSFAYGKNPQLVASYMAHHHEAMPPLLQQAGGDLTLTNGGGHGSELLKQCNYVVMGEEEFEKKACTDGYHLELTEEAIARDVVTVGKIWKLADRDELLQRDPRLKRLCLSFALYKLLRRRLEDLPITDAEARNCHDLIFKGLIMCQEQEADANSNSNALFQVFNDEVQFLCEYYHSVVPVVFATPFFFLINYIMFPIVVGAMCLLTIVLVSHGDVAYAFHSLQKDNYGASVGVVRIITCMLGKMAKSPTYLFAAVDICITILLALSFVYEQVWEFLVFIFSNWFVVSLLCSYASTSTPRQSRILKGVIRCIVWARDMLSQPNVCFKQFSILWFWRLSLTLPTKAVPTQAKKAIMERLLGARSGGASSSLAPTTAIVTMSSEEHRRRLLQLQSNSNDNVDDLLWVCDNISGGGVSEVMLTWHIATAMLEAWHPLQQNNNKNNKDMGSRTQRKVASALSGYCAYLVAFHPELLPDDKDGAERLYKETKEELRKEMGCSWIRYYFSLPGGRFHKLVEIAGRPIITTPETMKTTTSVLRKGARLGKLLIDKYEAAADEDARERVWKLLADVWTEVLVYAAPTDSELHLKAHKKALAQGGEFITILWAIATHTGIARGPPAPPACV